MRLEIIKIRHIKIIVTGSEKMSMTFPLYLVTTIYCTMAPQ